MARHKVVILNVPGGLPPFRARPPYLVVELGDEVRFINWAGAPVSLTFPGACLSKDDVVLNQGANDLLSVQDVPAGRYPYQGTVNGVPVEGESSPEIIVDR